MKKAVVTPKRKSKKEELAEDLYMNTDLSQKEICAIVATTEKTFTSWKQRGNWEIQKTASKITPKKIITKLYEQLHTISEADTLDADKAIKIASTIEKLSEKKVTVSAAINYSKDFTSWLFGINPELAKQVNLCQREYIDHLIKNEVK